MTNRIEIPWIGHYYIYEFFAERLEEDIPGVKINRDLKTAYEGLERISQEKFPLILVNDIFPLSFLGADGSRFSKDVISSLRDDADISKYVISQIKESDLNSDTPIIATIIPFKGYTDPESYIEAGANKVFTFDGIDELTLNVKEYLKIES